MRGLKQDRSARVVIAGHAVVQNVRRAHYELAVEEPVTLRLAVAFDELALRSDDKTVAPLHHASNSPDQQRLATSRWKRILRW
jgi:hypothetical protein